MSHKDHSNNRSAPQFAEPSFPTPKPSYSKRASTDLPVSVARGFNWPIQRQKALKHQFQRSIDLARTNIDYQVEFPNECRDNPDHKNTCHPEAKKRLIKKHEKILANAVVPPVDRPTRLNRLG